MLAQAGVGTPVKGPGRFPGPFRFNGRVLELSLEKPAVLRQVRLTFDNNLNRPVKITLSAKRQIQQQVGVPAELVKDYTVKLWNQGVLVGEKTVEGNFQRLNVLDLEPTLCDRVSIHFTATNGYENVTVFEVRLYE